MTLHSVSFRPFLHKFGIFRDYRGFLAKFASMCSKMGTGSKIEKEFKKWERAQNWECNSLLCTILGHKICLFPHCNNHELVYIQSYIKIAYIFVFLFEHSCRIAIFGGKIWTPVNRNVDIQFQDGKTRYTLARSCRSLSCLQ